jgi:SPP1 family predicted phage head-tail adaptor
MACIGNYTKKVKIQELTGGEDAHGFTDLTADSNWSDVLSSFASVKSKGGREFWKVDQVSADVSHVWLCPYGSELADVKPTARLVNEGVVYEILSVIDIDLAHEQIEIQTKRAV